MKIEIDKNNLGMLFLIICLAAILLIHGVAGMFNGGVTGFGGYLSSQGFGVFGVFLAWLIKLSHVATAVSILIRKWHIFFCALTIFILFAGIIMVHLPNGWFVVGGGSNGIEFNLLLICALLAVMCKQQNP